MFVFISLLSFSLFFLFLWGKIQVPKEEEKKVELRTNGLKNQKILASKGFEWAVEQTRGPKKKPISLLSLCKLRYFTLLNLFYLPQNALRRARSQEYTRDKIRKNAFLTSRSSPRRERERERAPLFFSFSGSPLEKRERTWLFCTEPIWVVRNKKGDSNHFLNSLSLSVCVSVSFERAK